MKRWPLNKAYFWETAPFFRILLPFATGIFFYDRQFMPVSGINSLVVMVAAFLLLLVIFYVKKNDGIYRFLTFFLVTATMFLGGLSVSYFSNIRNEASWFGREINRPASCLAMVSGIPVEKEHSWKLPLRILNVMEQGKISRASGNAFLYLYKDQLPMMLHKGDTVFVPDNWLPIKNAGNPFEFDYAAYCRRNNILYQQTCSINDIRLYSTNDPEREGFIEQSHNWCMAQLDKYITDTKTKGLIQAMLLGDEVNLDEDLRQSYAETGIIHIIAISGGNVAIFFVVISFLLRWMKNKKHLWIKYAIAMPLVWFYVLMAGAPPSAVRAAVMFSLLAFAVMFQKNNNSLNTLFATAFVLLYAQPMWLFSVGFQLSFVAVLSLILFYTPVYNWLSPVNKVFRYLWSAVAASIAAEVLVAPVVIYYFHIFPVLFLIANVIAALFMGIVLILGMAIIVLFFAPAVAKIIGIGTAWLVCMFDKIVAWLQSFNPESFHYLMITGLELVLIYITITGISLFIVKKQKPGLFTGLGACCLLFFSFCFDKWTQLNQQHFVVYNTGKVNREERIKGCVYQVFHTDTGQKKKIDYAVKPAHIAWRAWKQDSSNTKEIFDVNGKTVLLLNEQITEGKFHVDYLVVNYNGELNPGKLNEVFSPLTIVMGNGFSQKQWEKMARHSPQNYDKVCNPADKGAFIAD